LQGNITCAGAWSTHNFSAMQAGSHPQTRRYIASPL
jgi:hypothetical protein